MTTNNYDIRSDRMGNTTITRLSDNASVYLQGDDATEFNEQFDALFNITYPCGPFADLESHLDVIVSAYDEVMS